MNNIIFSLKLTLLLIVLLAKYQVYRPFKGNTDLLRTLKSKKVCITDLGLLIQTHLRTLSTTTPNHHTTTMCFFTIQSYSILLPQSRPEQSCILYNLEWYYILKITNRFFLTILPQSRAGQSKAVLLSEKYHHPILYNTELSHTIFAQSRDEEQSCISIGKLTEYSTIFIMSSWNIRQESPYLHYHIGITISWIMKQGIYITIHTAY